MFLNQASTQGERYLKYVCPEWFRGAGAFGGVLVVVMLPAKSYLRKVMNFWCREGESNPQGTKYRRILRLPITEL